MSSYSGAWRRQTLPAARVARHPEIHPEHATPVDVPDPTIADLTGAPQLPTEWSEGQYEQLPVGSLFVDQTPVSHDAPIGALPGVDLETAQALAGAARSVDLGAFDQRKWERPRYQETGSGHTEIVSGDNQGDSPETLRYQEKGVGVGIDPDARSNRGIRRQATGPAVIDMHWYGSEMRPRYAQTAQGSTVRPAVPGRQNNTPLEGAGTILRPDNWAAPVVRRSAPQWDQAHAEDTQAAGPADFGLGSWGL